MGSNLVAVTQISVMAPALSKEFLDIQAKSGFIFTLKLVHNMITYNSILISACFFFFFLILINEFAGSQSLTECSVWFEPVNF